MAIRIDVGIYLALLMVIAEQARQGNHTTLSDVVRKAITMYLQQERNEKHNELAR
jgi:Arc/MetJ-type ribon-helix-helix transcriptional regulator